MAGTTNSGENRPKGLDLSLSNAVNYRDNLEIFERDRRAAAV
jgi:hypothetical protein